MVWIANTEISLDSKNSIIKSLWCIEMCSNRCYSCYRCYSSAHFLLYNTFLFVNFHNSLKATDINSWIIFRILFLIGFIKFQYLESNLSFVTPILAFAVQYTTCLFWNHCLKSLLLATSATTQQSLLFQGIPELKEKIFNITLQQEYMGEHIPAVWLTFENNIARYIKI